MNISIIKPTLEHVEDICKICSIGWRQTVEGYYDENYKKKNIEEWYSSERVIDDIKSGTYVAMCDNKVVGTVGGMITKPGVSEIFVFYVDDTFRYKGIGKKLLDVFTAEHIDKGAIKQYVSVQEGNDLGIPFYEARGFRQRDDDKRYSRKLYDN